MIYGSAVMELSRAAGGASAEAEQIAGDYPPIWLRSHTRHRLNVFDQDKLIADPINGLRSMPPDFVEHFRRGDLSESAA
jgi:hypothetical protein